MSSARADQDGSELSYGEASLLALSQSAVSVDLSSGSEIYPEDSASHRNVALQRRVFGRSLGNADGPSLSSYNSSTAYERLYIMVEGRAFTAQSDLYALPADEEEHSRLDMQHFALCLSMDSLYPFKELVKEALRPRQASAPAVIDVGTGSGRWAVDMAVAFPWAEVVGVDLVPPALLPGDNVPKNCRFEVDDVNMSLDHYANTFSVVHARMVESGLNDTESFIYQVARILQPGGIFLLVTGDMQFWTEQYEPFPWVEPGEPGFSWAQYICGHAYRAYWRRGSGGANGTLWWKEWLLSNPNLTEVREEYLFVPLGPWKEGLNEREIFAANLMREDMARFFAACRRLLLTDGHTEADVNLWTEEAAKELREMTNRGYFRFKFFAATRTDAPWQERTNIIAVDLSTRTLIKGADVTKPWVRKDRSVPR